MVDSCNKERKEKSDMIADVRKLKKSNHRDLKK